jgi:hypothetical protein
MSILPSRNSTGFEFIKTESNMALKKGELQYRNFESKAKAIGTVKKLITKKERKSSATKIWNHP